MKTVLTEFQHRIPDAYQIKKYISENDPDEKTLDEWLFETIYKDVDWMDIEKQQIEKAYHSGLANEFGCMEDNKYYASTFTTNK